MTFFWRAALSLCCAIGFGAGATATADPATELGFDPAVTAAMQGIDPERIRAHVKFLSDDLLEGRGTGTRGGDIAANYIATQFALYGLEPKGDDGTFLQKVAFTGVHTEAGTTMSLVPTKGAAIDLTLGEDYVTSNQTQTDSVSIDAPIVFVGYGIEAPEYRWDDYKGVDVKGKVVLVIVNEPPSKDPKFFKAEAMTYYGRWTYKLKRPHARGRSVCSSSIAPILPATDGPVVKSSWSNEQVYLADDKDPKLESAAWIQLDVARRLFVRIGTQIGRYDRGLRVRANSRHGSCPSGSRPRAQQGS